MSSRVLNFFYCDIDRLNRLEQMQSGECFILVAIRTCKIQSIFFFSLKTAVAFIKMNFVNIK